MSPLHAALPSRRRLLVYGAVVALNVLLAVLGATRTVHTGAALGTLGVICGVIGGFIFWRHGGQRITAAGIFGLSCVIFGGVSAVFWSMRDDFVLEAVVTTAMVSIWLATAWTFFWHDSASRAPDQPAVAGERPPMQVTPRIGRVMMIVALVLSVGFAISAQFDYIFAATVPFQLTLGALVLLTSSILLSVGARWHQLAQLTVVVAVVLVAGLTVFNAYGRLNLVTLGLAGVVLVSHARRTAWLKPLLLAAVGPALLVLSYVRQRYIEQVYGVTTNGAASVFTPLRDSAELYNRVRSGAVDYDYGQSFLVSVVFWVPRALWEEKPAGLGAVLVDVLGRAETAPEGQSYAALFIGEWFFAGGWLALLISVVVIGVLVRLLDRWVVGLTESPKPHDPAWLLSLTLSMIMVTELANYVWVGSFGYTNRVVLRGAAIVLVLIGWLVWRRWKRRTTDRQTA